MLRCLISLLSAFLYFGLLIIFRNIKPKFWESVWKSQKIGRENSMKNRRVLLHNLVCFMITMFYEICSHRNGWSCSSFSHKILALFNYNFPFNMLFKFFNNILKTLFLSSTKETAVTQQFNRWIEEDDWDREPYWKMLSSIETNIGWVQTTVKQFEKTKIPTLIYCS